EAVGRSLGETLPELARGAEFAGLAHRLSEDERTRGNGGDLGWLRRERVPADLQEALFSAEIRKPILVRSRIGWHILEILEKKTARERGFEEAREEVLAALEAVKRRDGLRDYRKGLREREKRYIEVFFDVLERGL
ncbi:MAG: peptidylprolyl isomerase, partial [Roseibacillus sp.]|nr:peptidylprolyl isomerase [Roseibacillus sp.]